MKGLKNNFPSNIMADLSFWLLNYFPWLASYISLLSFLAPIIGGGELGVIAVAFLFGNDFDNFARIVIFSFAGMMAIDSIWFLIARSKIFEKIKKWQKIAKPYKKIEDNIENLSSGRDFWIITFAKLMAGTRILLLLYIGGRKIGFRRFTMYNFFPTFIWAILLGLIGFLAAKGFNSIIVIFRSIQLAITFLIVVLIVLYIMQKWINKLLIKAQKP